MEQFNRPRGVEGNFTPEQQEKIDTYAKKSLNLTKEQIEAILNSVLDEEQYDKGVMEGIDKVSNNLTKTSPTKTRISIDPEQETDTPKESFDIKEWIQQPIREGESILPTDPRTE